MTQRIAPVARDVPAVLGRHRSGCIASVPGGSWLAFSAMKIVLLSPSVTEASRMGDRSLKTPLHSATSEPGTTQLTAGCGSAFTGSEPIMPA